MNARLLVALMLAIVPLSISARTQSIDLSGGWALEAPQTEGQAADGSNWVMVAVSGTLTLDQKADAVTGSWKGRLPEPWPLTGRLQGATFELQTEVREIPASRNGEKRMLRRRWVFRGTVDGDKMTGSMHLAGEDGESPEQPFTAVRKR